MRISSMQLNQQGSSRLLEIGRQVAETQQQISSGRRVVKPGDDPVGAARIVKLNQELGLRAQFRQNIDSAEAQLAQEDVVLGQVVDVMQRIRELALQASNGVQTPDDRRFIATEISARFDELTSLVNARGPNGDYLFAGFQSQTEPFSISGNEIRFNGDEGSRKVQVAKGQYVAVTDSGKDIFVDIKTRAPVFAVRALPGNDELAGATISKVSVTDRDAIAEFFPDDLMIEFRPPSEHPDGVANFTVRRVSDGRVVDGLSNVAFEPGASVAVRGMNFRINGQPQVGDRFVVETTDKQDILSTVREVADGLQRIDPVSQPEAFQNLLGDTLTGLDNTVSRVLEAQASLGARMNTIESTRNLHVDLELRAQDTLSKVRDLDFAEAVSRLSFQSFLLEAAQQSFVRVSGLSLFNAL
ncbi:MAG: flagellar hook-associated protein FlgL [Pseudomonadales bacterium]